MATPHTHTVHMKNTINFHPRTNCWKLLGRKTAYTDATSEMIVSAWSTYIEIVLITKLSQWDIYLTNGALISSCFLILQLELKSRYRYVLSSTLSEVKRRRYQSLRSVRAFTPFSFSNSSSSYRLYFEQPSLADRSNFIDHMNSSIALRYQ